ncbi:MAG: patatin-like phospholipase family protein [Deltaproteobacteria bacterium]
MAIRNQKYGDRKSSVALVLQGGGALGAYHIGAYQALEEAGYQPDWVSGISIGAINSAVIVGNKPEDRLWKLERLWDDISWPGTWGGMLMGNFLKMHNAGSAIEALMFGQPNFFTPRLLNPYLAPAGTPASTSYYDTTPLRGTLERLVDFELINSRRARLSLGATRVTTGEIVFFDNVESQITKKPDIITPDHIIASGSLPPGFPAVRIDGELYWDGGCVSNTPLEAILDDEPDGHTIIFMIDLWDAEGPEPRTMDEVLWRQKRIQYASRTSHHIEAAIKSQNLRRAAEFMSRQLPPQYLDNPAVKQSLSRHKDCELDIVHIIYQPAEDQVSQSDTEFSRSSIAARRDAGYEDMKAALREAPWFKAKTSEAEGAKLHCVKAGRVIAV